MLTRRTLLGSSAAMAAAAGLVSPRRARAGAVNSSDLKFVFVMNYGGWDPTRVMAAEFDNPAVDMERGADAATVGDLTYVAHADRPSVTTFMERFYERTLFVNGILVPSIAHDNCLRLSMTGTTATTRSDWPAMLAAAQGESFPLPHLVIAGPSFSGDLGAMVTRTGSSGQLQALLSGSILNWSDVAVDGPSLRAEDVMDRYMERRAAAAAAAAASTRELALNEALARGFDRGQSLKDLLNVINWGGGTSFSSQVKLAVDALSLQISRCATLSFSYYGWDTHTQNDTYQSGNFENLYVGLLDLMDRLAAAPGTVGESLIDETVVVVLSEMGRTPQLNSADGKDHWPYSCAMVVGPGVTGNRVVGGYDYYYYGRPLDFDTGELYDEGQQLSVDCLGATLLNLGGVDSSEYMPGVKPVSGLLG